MTLPLQPLGYDPTEEEWTSWMSQITQWASSVNSLTVGLPITAQSIQDLVYNTDSTATATMIQIVDGLPPTGSFNGEVVYDESSENVYTWNASTSSWTLAGPTDLSQLQGQITSTQISAGAVTTPAIAAGAIVGSQIAATTITAANIVAQTITTTQISVGGVETTNIADSAVTDYNITVSSGGGPISFSYTETTINYDMISVANTTTGSPVEVDIAGYITLTGNGTISILQGTYFGVYRSGSLVGTIIVPPDNFGLDTSTTFVSLSIIDTPPSGTNTYTFHAHILTSGGSGTDVTELTWGASSIKMREFKR